MTWTKLAAIGLTLLSLIVIWKTYQIWSAAFLGILFALSINGPAQWLRCYIRMPQWLATSMVMLVALITLIGLGWAIGSPLAAQLDDMSKKLPQATQKVFDWMDQRYWGQNIIRHVEDWSGMSYDFSHSDTSDGDKTSSTMRDNATEERHQTGRSIDNDEKPDKNAQPDDNAPSMPNYAQIFRHAANLLSVTFETGMLLAVTLLVMIFVSLDPHAYERGLLWLVPKQYDDSARQLMDRLCVAIRWWMAGRLASMTAVGVLTALGMWIIGMPAPLALGAIAGILSFVPNIGPLVAAIPGLLLALGEGPWMAVWAACIYLAAQFVESNVFSPLVDQYAISVPPGLVILIQFVLAALAGVWGMIISTPLLVVVMVLVQQLYVSQGLRKPIEVTGSS